MLLVLAACGAPSQTSSTAASHSVGGAIETQTLDVVTSGDGLSLVAIAADTPGEIELAIAYDVGLEAGPSAIALAWALGESLELRAEVLPSVTLFRTTTSPEQLDVVASRLLSTATAPVDISSELLEAVSSRLATPTNPFVTAERLASSAAGLPTISQETPSIERALSIRDQHYGRGRALLLSRGAIDVALLTDAVERSSAPELPARAARPAPASLQPRFAMSRTDGLARAAAFVLVARNLEVATRIRSRAMSLGMRNLSVFALRQGAVVSGALDPSSELRLTSEIAQLRWLAESEERERPPPARSIVSAAMRWAHEGEAAPALGVGLVQPVDEAPLPESVGAPLTTQPALPIRVELAQAPGPAVTLTLMAQTGGDAPAALGLGALSAESLAACEADEAQLSPVATTEGWGVSVRAARLPHALDALAQCVLGSPPSDRAIADAALRLRARLLDPGDVALNRSWASFALAPLDRGSVASHGAFPSLMSISSADVQRHMAASLVPARLSLHARGDIDRAELDRGLVALLGFRERGEPMAREVPSRGEPRSVSHVRHSDEHVVITWDHPEVTREDAGFFVAQVAGLIGDAGFRVRFAESGQGPGFTWAAIGVQASLERRDMLLERLQQLQDPGFAFDDEPAASVLLREQAPRFVMSAPPLPLRR